MKRIEGQDIFGDAVAPTMVPQPEAVNPAVIPDTLPDPEPIEARAIAALDQVAEDVPDLGDPGVTLETIDEDFVEYGLTLPTGETAWGHFNGNVFTTPELRNQLFTRLQQTAVASGFDPAEFLNRYSWTVRVVSAHIERKVQPPSGEFNVADPRILSQQFAVEE